MVAWLEIRVCVGYFRSNEIPLVDRMMSFTNAGNRISLHLVKFALRLSIRAKPIEKFTSPAHGPIRR